MRLEPIPLDMGREVTVPTRSPVKLTPLTACLWTARSGLCGEASYKHRKRRCKFYTGSPGPSCHEATGLTAVPLYSKTTLRLILHVGSDGEFLRLCSNSVSRILRHSIEALQTHWRTHRHPYRPSHSPSDSKLCIT